MRRDFDLIRELLFQIEGGGRSIEDCEYFQLDGVTTDEAGYALHLMHENQLIDAIRSDEIGVPEFNSFYDVSLTWAGHDFLDSVRDNEVWKKTKAGAAAAGGITFDLMKSLAKGLVKKKIEQHTGVQLDI